MARKFSAILIILLAPCFRLRAEERWKIQFFYDKADTVLNIRDLQCPSAQRCIAAGVISDKKGHEKGANVLTSDGGAHWSLAEVNERPISLFFLNDSTGWMVTDRGIWFTEESGRTWKKQASPKGILRVLFMDAKHGFAVGFPKLVYETTDAGRNWIKVDAATTVATNTGEIVYDCIAFDGHDLVIVGRELQEGDERLPIWMNPNTARFRSEQQSTIVILNTSDLGKSWKASTSRLTGNLTRLRPGNGFVVSLVEYREYFTVPSSVTKLGNSSRKSQIIFAERDRAVTDIVLLPDGGALIAAIEPPGNTNLVPIPAKLKMLHSNNLKVWTELDVDYRAVAQRAVLAAPDAWHAWVATDTGMILSLVEDAKPDR